MFLKSIFFMIIFVLFSFTATGIYTLDEPKDPTDPSDKITKDSAKTEDTDPGKYNIEYMNKRGVIKKGAIKNKTGIYLKLKWEGNESGLQEILIDFVSAIRIKGYRKETQKVSDRLTRVFYYPDLYDIEMTDGRIIRNAKGMISALDKFTVYNEIGKETCFTYFVRYWYEDKKMFHDNHSTDFDEEPPVPDPVIIYVEFIKNDSRESE